MEHDDVAIFLGDFNINRKANEETHVLRGAVPRNAKLDATADMTALPPSLEYDTGFTTTTTDTATNTATDTATDANSATDTASGGGGGGDVGGGGGWSSFNWARSSGAPLTLVDAHEGLSAREQDEQVRVWCGCGAGVVRVWWGCG